MSQDKTQWIEEANKNYWLKKMEQDPNTHVIRMDELDKEEIRVKHEILPEHGKYYWVKMYFDADWEIARAKLLRKKKLFFCFTDGTAREIPKVCDWLEDPIPRPDVGYTGPKHKKDKQ